MRGFRFQIVAIATILLFASLVDGLSREKLKNKLSGEDNDTKTSTNTRPGIELAAKNVKAYSPVVLVPGFSSVGLEIWKGEECGKSHFRQQMWGTARMLQQFVLNQKCWLKHVMLNRTTGLDPDGIKLRATEGLDAADYVIGGYWVWGKIIENLADIGYDGNNLFMSPYDWRLSPILLEQRDKYFTKLKFQIEMAYATNDNRKVVVIAHSYGTQVMYFFLQWVESEKGGRGGPTWVDEHIETFVNIAGPTLGSTKAISFSVSGEMKDTTSIQASTFLSNFFPAPARAVLARSFTSLVSLLPLGGETIWGNSASAPDDIASVPVSESEGTATRDKLGSNGNILQFVDNAHSNVTMDKLRSFMGSIDPNLAHFHDLYDGEVKDVKTQNTTHTDPQYWINPLVSSLPKAPKMKLFCLYGVGKAVERGYIYRNNSIADDEVGPDGRRTVPYVLHTKYDDLPWIKAGIRYTDGDGTVPLISLGFMCARGWRLPQYNPSGLNVTVREYKHKPASLLEDSRGGPTTADHVDILGNHDMIRDVLRIAAKEYEHVPEHISSNILEIASRVQL